MASSQLAEISRELAVAQAEAKKLEAGQKVAATRLRKALLNIKSNALEGRKAAHAAGAAIPKKQRESKKLARARGTPAPPPSPEAKD